MSVLQSNPSSDGTLKGRTDLAGWQWLSDLPAALYTCDAAGRIQFYNQAAVELWGREPRAGHDLWCGSWKIYNPDGTPLSLDACPMALALREGRSVRGQEIVIERPDGTRRNVLPYPDPLRDGEGRVVGAANMLVDITEAHRTRDAVRQSEEWLRAIFDSSAVGVALLSPQARFLEVNEAFAKIVGYSPQELLSLDCESLIHRDDRRPMRRQLAELIAGRVSSFAIDTRAHRKDGAPIWVQSSVSLVRDPRGNPLHLVALCQDITDRKQAIESRSRLAAIVESSTDAIISKTLEGTIQSWNFGAEQLFGYTAQEACGRSITLLIPLERRHEEEMIIGRVSRGERVEHYETVRVAKDGRRIEVSLNVSPVRDDTGRIIGASKVARDVTERKQAQREIQKNVERFGRLANTVPMVIWTAAPDGTITFCSDRWYEYTGLTPQENASDWPRRVLHPDDYDRCVARWTQAVASGEEYDIEVRNRRHDGEYRWWMTRATPIKDAEGQTLEWFGSSADIHDLKLAEQALMDADRRKDEFLATLAHELRNPLAPIRSSLHLLKITAGDESVAKIHEMLERQVNHMVRLVDDLLEVSRISRGTIVLRRESVPLAAIIRNAVDASRPQIDAANHQLAVSLPAEPLFLNVDPVRMAQVVSNLLNNAARYTDHGGQIWLSASQRGSDLTISVRDTGIGIRREELAKIFEMFTQLDRSRQISDSGLGIGLSLANSLVQLHGGRIEASSEGPGKGSEFTVYLPLAKVQGKADEQPAAPTSSPAAARSSAGDRPRVLIVDDNRDAANSLAMLLSLMSAEVAVAHDGPSALELLPKHRPTIMLLDIGMPGMDGFEVARRVRAHPAGKEVKLVALTGWGQESDRYRIRESGFDVHLVKPADMAAIEALLET